MTKKRHYIPYNTDKDGTTVVAIAYLLLNNVWKLHGLPLFLTFNQGSQFILGVWKNLCKILSIKANLSTLFHLAIYEQSKIANQEMERYICSFINNQQDDLLKKLAIAEFVAHNNISASTKLSLFFATKSLYPYISFDIVELSNASAYKEILK